MAGAVLQSGWTGGERIEARTLEDGLVSRGHEVHTWAYPRSSLALGGLVASPVDWDVVSLLRYQRLLRHTKPDVVLGFYDYDTSLCRATSLLGIPYISCAHIYWPICPIVTLYIDASGICTGSAWGKCVRHMSQDRPDSRLPGKLGSLPGPLGLGVYAKYTSTGSLPGPSRRDYRAQPTNGHDSCCRRIEAPTGRAERDITRRDSVCGLARRTKGGAPTLGLGLREEGTCALS